MLVPELRKRVYDANMELPVHGLVKFTWGNVSAIDRQQGLIAIKPSGVPYDQLSPRNMVVTDLDGKILEGELNPSSDLPTHVELYKAWPEIGGIVHTHSTEGVAWAQAGRDIPCYGTTHADTFYGPIPCARALTPEEINGEYEKETGKVIIEEFAKRKLDPLAVSGVTVRNHGPFAWGKDENAAVYNAVVLEEVARMDRYTESLDPSVQEVPQALKDKHYLRKHGKDAYYGQEGLEH